jgi:hypothetical protein
MCCLPAVALAQSKTGTSIGQFLLIEPSARWAGMGNAAASLGAGLHGAYYNPAAAASVEDREVVFTHSAWFADIAYDHAAVAMRLPNDGRAYASVTSLSSGEIDVRTVTQPHGTGERYSASDVAIGIGYAATVTDRFAVGGQVTYVQESIWHVSASAACVNMGTIYRMAPEGLHIGASLSNFGTRAKYSGRDLRILYDQDPTRFGDNGTLPGEAFTESFSLPVLLRLGLGYPVRLGEERVLQVAVDAFHQSDNTESVSVGSQLLWRDALALRAGYQHLFQDDSETGLTLGAGVRAALEALTATVDYTWADHGRLGSTHRVSVATAF